jgi:hypothetical protein
MASMRFYWPPMLQSNNGTPMVSSSNFVLSTTSTSSVTGYGWVFRVQETTTITSISFLVSAVNGSPGTIRGGIKNVNTTAGTVTADTTTWAGTNTAFGTATTWTAGAWKTITLGTSLSVTRGDVYAIWLQPSTGTWSVGNDDISIQRSYTNIQILDRAPYGIQANGSTTVSKNAVTTPCFMYHSSTKSYGWPFTSATDIGAAIDSGSSPDEFGLRFRLPSSSCSSYSVAGVLVSGLLGTGDWDLVLYDSNGTTELQNITIDKDQIYNAASYPHHVYFNETTLSALLPNTYYRVTLRPTSATSMGTTHYWTLKSAGDRNALVDQAADINWCERTNAGAWTDTDTRLPVLQLIITDMTATASGGLAANPLAGYVR